VLDIQSVTRLREEGTQILNDGNAPVPSACTAYSNGEIAFPFLLILGEKKTKHFLEIAKELLTTLL